MDTTLKEGVMEEDFADNTRIITPNFTRKTLNNKETNFYVWIKILRQEIEVMYK